MAASNVADEMELLNNGLDEIVQRIAGSQLDSYVLNSVQDHLAHRHASSDLHTDIQNIMTRNGLDTILENAVYKEITKYQTTQSPHSNTNVTEEERREPLSCLRKAQQTWEKRIAKSLNTMCTDLNMPLAKSRGDKDTQELVSHWSEIGTIEIDVSNIRPVYGPKDFLEVLINIVMLSRNEELLSQFWGLLKVPIQIKSLHELRVQFTELAINQSQHGVDDEMEVPQELYAQERFKLGKKVLTDRSSILAQEYCKNGCPASLRAELWKQILGVEVKNVDRLYYEQLKQAVLTYDLLVDLLYYKDIKLTATNDDQYFVFEDYVFQVLLPFSRDTRVLELTKTSIGTPAKSYIRGKLGMPEYSVIYPPNGVIPFYGFSMLSPSNLQFENIKRYPGTPHMYIAPLCYLYNDVHVLYYMFREMYMRYFHKLHIISSDKQGILGLATLFESLLLSQEPQLFFHLKNNDIHPLKIAFKWLMRGFSGFLSSKENLLLWDRVLAYDTLEVLPVLAVAIFSFRKLNLFQVKTQSQAEAVLADLTTIKVVPLLQLSLFSR